MLSKLWQKRRLRAAVIIGAIAVAIGFATTLGREDKVTGAKTSYFCPMHPTYTSDRPGTCPICNMDLIPASAIQYYCLVHPDVTATQAGYCDKCGNPLEPELVITTTGRELAGVETIPADSRQLQHTIRTVGTIVADETRITHIHTRVEGWIEKLYVNFTGQLVHEGDPLFVLYSPELLASQKQYLVARDIRRKTSATSQDEEPDDAVVKAARKRLELFDIPEQVIAAIEKTGTPQEAVTFLAPNSGFVTSKPVFEGHRVEPGMELFTITDISRVWIEADFYELESHLIKLGQEAKITSPYDPTIVLPGKVAYIYPYLNPVSRTLKVRFDFPNPEFRLKLGMYVNVNLLFETVESIVIPDSAILDSGMRKVAFVEIKDGTFEPRQVQVGIRSEGNAQILSGIELGEAVVVKGNFLLDSESRLRAAISEVK